MGSPLILERSGIGRKDVLDKAGIPVISELPGVGENYQGTLLLFQVGSPSLTAARHFIDHPFYVAPYIADPATTTIDSLFRREPETMSRLLEQWEKDGTGLMGAK